VDWNSDGEWDIISGDRYGYLNLFIYNPTDSTMTAYYKVLLQSGDTLDVGYNSEPNVFDWNSDGKKDLVIGVVNFDRANPYIFDLNQDGLLDLICGEQNGYVHYYENVTTNSDAEFAAGETLKLHDGTPVRWTRTTNSHGSRCGFGDWNNDSIPDFLLSTYEGQLELYRGLGPAGIEELSGPCIRDFTVSPNPGSRVTIECNLRRSADAHIEIVDGLGRTVKDLGTVVAGQHRAVEWDGTDNHGRSMATGVYFCRLVAGDDSRTGRLVLLH